MPIAHAASRGLRAVPGCAISSRRWSGHRRAGCARARSVARRGPVCISTGGGRFPAGGVSGPKGIRDNESAPRWARLPDLRLLWRQRVGPAPRAEIIQPKQHDKNIDIFVDYRFFLPHLFFMPEPNRVSGGQRRARKRQKSESQGERRHRPVRGSAVRSMKHLFRKPRARERPGTGGVRLCPGHHRNTAGRHPAAANAGAAALPVAANCRASRRCSRRRPGPKRV